jgi:hypothetical protein
MQLKQIRRDDSIRVDKQIVNLLSRSTYESFPRVLRELVSNSYDADATEVNIEIMPNEIYIKDNGNGMNPDQFHYFLTIAGSARSAMLSPRYKRERIGQFGVGFLASFPFCEEMIVETISVNSATVISATIPCSKYLARQNSEDEASLEPVEEITVPIIETQDPRKYEEHYTHIKLKGLTKLALQYFDLNLPTGAKHSIKDKYPMERLKWDLQDTLILDYPEKSKIADAINQPKVGMDVYLNNIHLFRNEPPGQIMETEKFEVNGLSVRYVITSPWQPVYPIELRGLRIRVNNVGVGSRETLGFSVQAGALTRLYWLSGDVYIDKGAREYLALNREGFTNAPAIEKLNDILRSALRRVNDSLTETDTVLKEVEAGLGMNVHGGGPRPKPFVGSKRELIKNRMNQLEKAGFKVEHITSSQKMTSDLDLLRGPLIKSDDSYQGSSKKTSARLVQEPIEIDRQSKIIRIYESHPEFEDVIQTSFGKFSLIFESWNYLNSDFPACQLLDKNIVRVNKSYPLFQSRKLGQLFLHLAVTMAIMSFESNEKKDFARDLLLDWTKEFKDLAD